MTDRLEPAASGRARCRACGGKIDKGVLRFGEELPNAYGEGDDPAVHWFHPRCAAQRRPEKFAPFARDNDAAAALPDRDGLRAEADFGLAHDRLPRIAGAEPSATGRARCRQCKELIPQGGWRISLSSFGQSGFFEPLGFIHAGCGAAYFGTTLAIPDRVRQATPAMDDAAAGEFARALAQGAGSSAQDNALDKPQPESEQHKVADEEGE